MRKKQQEITDARIIEDILSQGSLCRLAMAVDNEPYLLPFNYGYRDRTIYIHSAREGKKLDILKKNPRVCFEVEGHAELVTGEKACDWTTQYRSVVGHGDVEIITHLPEKEEGLRIIMRHNGMSGDISFKRKAVDACVILKISIQEVSGKQSGGWAEHNE